MSVVDGAAPLKQATDLITSDVAHGSDKCSAVASRESAAGSVVAHNWSEPEAASALASDLPQVIYTAIYYQAYGVTLER